MSTIQRLNALRIRVRELENVIAYLTPIVLMHARPQLEPEDLKRVIAGFHNMSGKVSKHLTESKPVRPRVRVDNNAVIIEFEFGETGEEW